MDFTAQIAALTSMSGPLAISLAAIAAIFILPGVAKWGYDRVIGWFDDSPDEDGDDDNYARCYYCGDSFMHDELDRDPAGVSTCAECFDYTSERDE